MLLLIFPLIVIVHLSGVISDHKCLKKSLRKLKSLVKFTKNGTVLREKRIHILKKLAGMFLIFTNNDLTEEVVSAYKEQWQTERSFRTIKSFIEIWPVYHMKSDRIKAHVFLCVLSLPLSGIMDKHTGGTMDSIRKGLNGLDAILVVVEKGDL